MGNQPENWAISTQSGRKRSKTGIGTDNPEGVRQDAVRSKRQSLEPRRRVQSNDPTTKLDWVNEINGILLSQADKYREQRLKEMANMGVGNKPLMDIGGSNTITDRSVPIQTARLRNSIALGDVAMKSQSIPRNVSLFSAATTPSNGNGSNVVKRRPNSLVSTAPSSDCSSSTMGLSRQCTVPSIFTKSEDVFDDDDSEAETQPPQAAYRQYETTV